MNREKNVTRFLLGIYTVMLVWIILFKLCFSLGDISALVGQRSINLIPFYYDEEVSFHLREIIENILIFIPFGLYLKMIAVELKKVLLYGTLFSFSLEFCQYLFQIGAGDITDIITNTVGTAIGALCYILIRKYARSKELADKVLRGCATILTVLFIAFILFIIICNRS